MTKPAKKPVRGRPPKLITLSPLEWAALDEMKQERGMSRGQLVAALVEEANSKHRAVMSVFGGRVGKP